MNKPCPLPLRSPTAFVLIFLILIVTTAPVQGAVDNLNLRYQVHRSGFHIADMEIDVAVDRESYHSAVTLVARGLVGALSGWRSVAESRGHMRGDGDPLPAAFARKVGGVLQRRTMRVIFDQRTGVAAGEIDGEPDAETALALRHRVVDPLTAFLLTRHRIGKDLPAGRPVTDPGPFTVPVYDGERRYDLRVDVGLPGRVLHAGGIRETRVLMLTLDPLAGFTDEQRHRWADSRIEVVVARDGGWTPLRAVAETGWGTTVIELVPANGDTLTRTGLP